MKFLTVSTIRIYRNTSCSDRTPKLAVPNQGSQNQWLYLIFCTQGKILLKVKVSAVVEVLCLYVQWMALPTEINCKILIPSKEVRTQFIGENTERTVRDLKMQILISLLVQL